MLVVEVIRLRHVLLTEGPWPRLALNGHSATSFTHSRTQGVSTVSPRISGPAPLMTELLRKAFEEASKLPPQEQDALASVLLDEIDGEQEWDSALTETQDRLASLADAALAEHRAGKTDTLDPEKM